MQIRRSQLWATLKVNGKVVKDVLLEAPYEGALFDPLTTICNQLDLERPVLLHKHEKEWAEHRRTTFMERDFIGDFEYDSLFIEHFEQKEARK